MTHGTRQVEKESPLTVDLDFPLYMLAEEVDPSRRTVFLVIWLVFKHYSFYPED
jgi:hypothetical protein